MAGGSCVRIHMRCGCPDVGIIGDTGMCGSAGIGDSKTDGMTNSAVHKTSITAPRRRFYTFTEEASVLLLC